VKGIKVKGKRRGESLKGCNILAQGNAPGIERIIVTLTPKWVQYK
jgi:hypothetical protein